MFTGIVQCMGKIVAVRGSPSGARLLVDPSDWPYCEGPGESISVGGVCLTHAPSDDEGRRWLAFDVVRETLNRTTLGSLEAGSSVNLEPSLRPDTPMGGHFVQGHIDGIGTIKKVEKGKDWRVVVDAPATIMAYIIPKGSIAIDGVSLTVVWVREHAFEVALIPTTLSLTTLGQVEPGTRVNLESDILTRTIVHTLETRHTAAGSVTRQILGQAGFTDG